MFVDMLIFGTLAYAGLKAYRKKKRLESKNSDPVSVTEIDANVVEVLIDAPSHTQKATSKTEDDDPLTVNQHYTLASISLGLSASGTLIASPLLNVLSVPINLYNSVPNIQQSYEALYEENSSYTSIIYTLVMLGSIGSGYYLLASFIDWSYYLNAKLTENLLINLRRLGSTILDGQPSTVWVQNEKVEVEIPFEELKVGEVIIVQRGEIIPVDGIITEGSAEIFQLQLSNKEDSLIEKTVGDSVFAWTLVMSGNIYVRVNKLPENVRHQAKYQPA